MGRPAQRGQLEDDERRHAPGKAKAMAFATEEATRDDGSATSVQSGTVRTASEAQRPPVPAPAPANPLLSLQSRAGNRATVAALRQALGPEPALAGTAKPPSPSVQRGFFDFFKKKKTPTKGGTGTTGTGTTGTGTTGTGTTGTGTTGTGTTWTRGTKDNTTAPTGTATTTGGGLGFTLGSSRVTGTTTGGSTTTTAVLNSPDTATQTTGPQPPAPTKPLKTRVEEALTGTVTLRKVQDAYLGTPYSERQVLTTDAALMGKIKSSLPAEDWLRVIADLGVYASGGIVAHTSAKVADSKIREDLREYVGEAVKAGRSVEGQVVVLEGQDWLDAYYHEFPDELPRGGPTDEEPRTTAFTTSKPPKNVIVLNKDKGNPGTTVHEGMHLYQHNDLLTSCGMAFNEGVTELFTRKVTDPMGIARTNYDFNYDAMVKVRDAVGEEVLARAYFDGKVAELKNAFIKFRKGKGDNENEAATKWGRLVAHFRAKEWGKAKDLCK
jgi:hypothetical protein